MSQKDQRLSAGKEHAIRSARDLETLRVILIFDNSVENFSRISFISLSFYVCHLALKTINRFAILVFIFTSIYSTYLVAFIIFLPREEKVIG